MNFFLYINRKLLLVLSLITLLLFSSLVFFKQFSNNEDNMNYEDDRLSEADIYQPKFAINNENKKIYISAKEGNFINKNEILLKNKVKFKSNDFSIETEKVIFDRDKQTAESETLSFFKSKNTTIISNGFNINEKGNKITFYGKSTIVLK